MTALERLPRLGGMACLDFVNSIDPRYGENRVEYLGDYPALVEWAVCAGVLPETCRESLLKAAADHPRKAAAVHRRALALREDLHGLLRPARADPPLRAFNEEVRRASAHATVRADASGYSLGWDADGDLDRPLWPVVRSAGELMLTRSSLDRVRECDGRDCGWLFLDTSKAGRRRWCRMEICGNRAKAERHRRAHPA